MKRLPILYVIFAVLVLVSVAPLLIYGTKVIGINREALETNEKELQNTITRSVAEEVGLYESSIRQQLQTLGKSLEPILSNPSAWQTGSMLKNLEQFVASNPRLLYVTLLNEQGRGIRAGNYNADADQFLRKVLERAFTAAQQGQPMESEPVMIVREGKHAPVMVISMPFMSASGFRGMLAVVADLEPLVQRLKDHSRFGLEAFVVDGSGRLMLHPTPENNPIGQDLSGLQIVNRFREWTGEARARETSTYDVWKGSERIPMLGTYCSIPGLHWAVIAQKKQADAYYAVTRMQQATTWWGALALLISLVVAYFSALRITTPINVLAESARAIARGDFTRRIELRSRTEIGELAANFNHMTNELERYVEQLKNAAEENHELFVSSVRMIAAAVDEKDPYTHGHSERVTRYSVAIATEMGLSEEELYKVRIAALLHDVGKIGIEDRVLKKPGPLTPEEFEIMKTHTTKGATILRPIEKLSEMIPGVELHHESLDGRGYPYGLKGEEIPILPRIIAVADTFDAMTTNRPYQAAREHEDALRYIVSQAGRKYDERCAAALQQAFEGGRLKLMRSAIVV